LLWFPEGAVKGENVGQWVTAGGCLIIQDRKSGTTLKELSTLRKRKAETVTEILKLRGGLSLILFD
jgi:hypothetical protein